MATPRSILRPSISLLDASIYLHKSATCPIIRTDFTLHAADGLIWVRRGGLNEFIVLPE